MQILRAYFYLLARHRWAYVLGGGSLLLSNGLALVIPRVLGWAVDALGQGTTRSVLIGYGGTIMVLAVVQTVTRVGSRVWVLSISRRIDYQLKGMMHDHIMRLAPSFFSAVSTGDLMSRMTNDIMLVRALGGPGVLYFFNAILLYVMGLGFMLSINWRLALIVFVPLPLMAWFVRGLVQKAKEYATGSRIALADLNTMVQENLNGVQVVKSFALEEAQCRRFGELSETYVDWNLKEAMTRAKMVPLVGLSGGIATLAVLGIGTRMVAAGSMTVGDLVAFFTYIGMLVFPTVALGWILSLIQRGAAALERLDAVLKAPITISSPEGSKTTSPTAATVQAQGFTFRYDDALAAYQQILRPGREDEGGRRAALQEVDFEAEAGSFVALVGKVGSGKSTLLKAIIRLVEVPAGRVTIDEIDLTCLDLDDLRHRIGYVPQDDFLFSSSLAANIAYGMPNASAEEIEQAAEIAGLVSDLARMPDGLDTVVGERGLTLSGGQRQRVALARAILPAPAIMVLDNALSNIDSDTERRILDRLHTSRRQCTLIVASNRISAVRDADRIYVMDMGRVVDVGRHEELIQRPGLYADMHAQQKLSAELEQL
jgi:ATP-binding cassette subfamily B multidrug efflux pump